MTTDAPETDPNQTSSTNPNQTSSTDPSQTSSTDQPASPSTPPLVPNTDNTIIPIAVGVSVAVVLIIIGVIAIILIIYFVNRSKNRAWNPKSKTIQTSVNTQRMFTVHMTAYLATMVDE